MYYSFIINIFVCTLFKCSKYEALCWYIDEVATKSKSASIRNTGEPFSGDSFQCIFWFFRFNMNAKMLSDIRILLLSLESIYNLVKWSLIIGSWLLVIY